MQHFFWVVLHHELLKLSPKNYIGAFRYSQDVTMLGNLRAVYVVLPGCLGNYRKNNTNRNKQFVLVNGHPLESVSSFYELLPLAVC